MGFDTVEVANQGEDNCEFFKEVISLSFYWLNTLSHNLYYVFIG